MSKIVVIGSSNIDLIARVAHLPQPGETVGNATFMEANGGKGANQAVAAARLHGDVMLVTCVGDDPAGEALRRHFAAEGVNTFAISVTRKAPTGTALIFVAEDGENAIAVAPGANNHLLRCDIDAAGGYIAAADYALLQLEIPLDSVCYAAAKAHRNGVKVVLNPAPAMALPDELLRKLYLLTPNRTECERLTGMHINNIDDATLAADILLEKGVQNIIVTLGRDGALFKNAQTCEAFPAHQVKAVDTTAAGDVFNGALVVALSEGRTFHNAICFASAAAALSVTRMGAQTSIPRREEVDMLLPIKVLQ